MNQKSSTGEISKSGHWLEESLHMAQIGNWQWDVLTDSVTWSEELYNIYGLNAQTFGASFDGYLERIHPDDRKRVKETILKALNSKQKVIFEERIIRPNNEVRFLRSWASVSLNEYGYPVKMYGTCVDVTDSKENEIALVKKEKVFGIILNRITDAFVALDKKWNFTYVNDKAAAFFGKSPESLLGKHIFTELPENISAPFRKAYSKAIKSQSYIYMEEYYLPYKKWIESHIYPSADGITIYFRDVTSRKKAHDLLNSYNEQLEQEVKKRTRNIRQQNSLIREQKEEIIDIIKELHHRVKNNMQIVISLLRVESARARSPKVREIFSDCQNRVHSMELIHEKLYQNNNLTRVNSTEYFPGLLKEIVNSFSLEKKIGFDLKIDSVELGTKVLVPIGLLVNEIVLNSLKHAFKSTTKGIILFHFLKLKGNKIKILVGDNGVGMNKGKPIKNKSLGLEIIESFIQQLEGTWKRVAGAGTIYEIEFQLKK
jgi:PAS domain S-box-containing protein